MAKKKRGHEAAHENHERWLLTYADMITLLVAFFIMLYAMSVMNVSKFQQLAISVRSGFGSSMTQGAPTITHGGGNMGHASIISNSQNNKHDEKNQGSNRKTQQFPAKGQEESVRLDDLARKLKAYVVQKGLQQKVGIKNDARGVIITLMTDKMLFDSGRADLRPEEHQLLNSVGLILEKEVTNPVVVEGHTDDLPIHTGRFPSNWELSTARATAVLTYLGGHGVPPVRLEAATGYADRDPVDPDKDNKTADDRRRNRRVDIVVVRQFPPTRLHIADGIAP